MIRFYHKLVELTRGKLDPRPFLPLSRGFPLTDALEISLKTLPRLLFIIPQIFMLMRFLV